MAETLLRPPFTAEQNTDIQPVCPPEIYKKFPNGSYTFQIKATDSKGESTVRSYAFTKAVYVAEMKLANPLPADDMPTAAMLSVQGAFPQGSVLEAWIANNAFDEEPVWQDVSSKVNSGRIIALANTEKTADEWGISVRVRLSRNDAVGNCYISGVSGTFR